MRRGATRWILFAALALAVGATTMGLRKKPAHKVPLGPEDHPARARLEASVRTLAEKIGERNLQHPLALDAAATYIEGELATIGPVTRQEFSVRGQKVRNLELSLPGTRRPEELVVIGAHYDSVIGTPGADDNASGVAALLELARTLGPRRHARSLRFVAFVNEEPPYFQSAEMGSFVYARTLKEQGAKVHAMLSLETIGYFSDEDGSQRYPVGLSLFYPSSGNFMAVVGNRPSAQVVDAVADAFKDARRLPVEKAALPTVVEGVAWSDQWSFWEHDFVGVMVTDTAPFRNPHYHAATDVPDTLDFDRLTHTVRSLELAVQRLAGSAD